jgi:hypothetical protein
MNKNNILLDGPRAFSISNVIKKDASKRKESDDVLSFEVTTSLRSSTLTSPSLLM